MESEKVGLKLNIQKTKIMASGPITSWEIDGETVEIVADFIFFLGPQIRVTMLGKTQILELGKAQVPTYPSPLSAYSIYVSCFTFLMKYNNMLIKTLTPWKESYDQPR